MKLSVKKLKNLLKKHKELRDLIIFGSYVKGKINARDIDIAAILSDKIDKTGLKKEISKIFKKEIDLQTIGIDKYDSFIWVTLIREGFSVKHNKYLAEVYKIEPKILFKYSLKELTPSKKVMFERAIKKFDGIEKLSNRVVLVNYKDSEEFKEFLKYWEIDIDTQEYGLMPLVRKDPRI